jgi:hypothetical protein
LADEYCIRFLSVSLANVGQASHIASRRFANTALGPAHCRLAHTEKLGQFDLGQSGVQARLPERLPDLDPVLFHCAPRPDEGDRSSGESASGVRARPFGSGLLPNDAPHVIPTEPDNPERNRPGLDRTGQDLLKGKPMRPDVTTPVGIAQGFEPHATGRHNGAEAIMTDSDAPKQPAATVSVEKAAEFLDISEEAVREGIRNGMIPGFSYGKRPNYKVWRAPLLRLAGYPEDYDFGD